MNKLFNAIGAVGVWILAFGLFGGAGSQGFGTIDIALIAVWLFAWLGERETAVVFALIIGLLFDLVSFLPFGYWSLLFVSAVLLTDWLKSRFLTESSFFQALAVLLIVSLLSQVATSLLLGTTNFLQILTSSLLNLLFGGLIYYLLAIRMKMFQRWTGKRL